MNLLKRPMNSVGGTASPAEALHHPMKYFLVSTAVSFPFTSQISALGPFMPFANDPLRIDES